MFQSRECPCQMNSFKNGKIKYYVKNCNVQYGEDVLCFLISEPKIRSQITSDFA